MDVAFPFGHGLSYTTFAYGSPTVIVALSGDLTVTVPVMNTGDRDGREVVQVYVAPLASAVERAPRELKAFANVEISAGATQDVTVTVPREDLAYWDIRVDRWVVEGGTYRVDVAASSRDVRAGGRAHHGGQRGLTRPAPRPRIDAFRPLDSREASIRREGAVPVRSGAYRTARSLPWEDRGMSSPLDSQVPVGTIEIPLQVSRLASGDDVRAVWVNGVGGTTFRVAGPAGVRFIKWHPGPAPAAGALQPDGRTGPPGDGALAEEARRLAWARERGASVPRVVDAGADDDGSWLVTAGLPGLAAVVEPWLSRPVVAARAIGAGLRAFHDALPVEGCPWTWAADVRLARARARAASSGPGGWTSELLHPDHRGFPRAELLARLADVPDVDRLVVAHGDACAPNTLLAEDGTYLGTIDLDALGVADRWADLAVAGWSTSWNYGRDLTAEVCAAYGVDPDEERLSYYRLLWDLA